MWIMDGELFVGTKSDGHMILRRRGAKSDSGCLGRITTTKQGRAPPLIWK